MLKILSDTLRRNHEKTFIFVETPGRKICLFSLEECIYWKNCQDCDVMSWSCLSPLSTFGCIFLFIYLSFYACHALLKLLAKIFVWKFGFKILLLWNENGSFYSRILFFLGVRNNFLAIFMFWSLHMQVSTYWLGQSRFSFYLWISFFLIF